MLSLLLKKGTEHAHQVAFFAYCAVAYHHGWSVADKWCERGDRVLHGRLRLHDEQPFLPVLEWIHAIPNGGSRGDDEQSRKIAGARLRAEGVRKGVADIFLPCPNKNFHGLYIEMKLPEKRPTSKMAKGGMSDEQIEFANYVKKAGYAHEVCYGCSDAINAVKKYIENSLTC